MIIEDALAGVKRKKFLEENIRCFFSLVKSEHKKTLDVGCGKGAMDYLGAKEGKFKDISACDVFDDFQIGTQSDIVAFYFETATPPLR